LDLILKPFWKKGPEGAIDKAGDQGFPIARPPFPLEEASRDPPRRIGHFLVIDGERDKVKAFSPSFRRNRCDQYDRFTILYQYSTIRLSSHPSRFDRKGSSTKIGLQLLNHMFLLTPSLLNLNHISIGTEDQDLTF
jgi:hypothetical protein